jgi:PAS domain S-box-containing protein
MTVDGTDEPTRERELERYRTLVETVGDPMYVLDAEGRLEMVNEVMARTIGRPRSELVGEHVSTFMPEADVRRGTELLVDLADDPDRRWTSFEMDAVLADGERIRCEDRVAALVEDGELVGSVGVLRDITDRVEERQRLEQLTGKVEQLHDVATELQSANDPEQVYRLAVDAGETILGFGWNVVAVPREGWLEIAAVSDGAPLSSGERHLRVDEGLAGAAFQDGESKLTHDTRADDVSEPAHDSFAAGFAVPLGGHGVFQATAEHRDHFDGGDVEVAELLAAHVTEALHRIERESALRERERELQRQNERLEQFASAVSHDLRNPLNLADGRLVLALDAVEDGSEAAEELAEVEWALDRIDRLIEEVLTLAREGQEPDDTEQVALADVLEAAWSTTAEGEAELVVTADPGTVDADRDRLVRLLENLFRNAVEHAGPDSRVSVGPTESGFYVADDGPGIPPSERDRVFDSGYTTARDGTGFGLAIVRELAEAHGWTVRLDESEAGGARFEFRGARVDDGAGDVGTESGSRTDRDAGGESDSHDGDGGP